MGHARNRELRGSLLGGAGDGAAFAGDRVAEALGAEGGVEAFVGVLDADRAGLAVDPEAGHFVAGTDDAGASRVADGIDRRLAGERWRVDTAVERLDVQTAQSEAVPVELELQARGSVAKPAASAAIASELAVRRRN